MLVSQVAEALAASMQGRDVLMTGVSKDTRNIHQGDLYVALKGERFDGHAFVRDAGEAGAVAALVSEPQDADMTQLKVDDTRLALGRLAAHWRGRWRSESAARKLIGITGSNGKTSVKEMCSSILSDHAGAEAVLATRGNLNNDIGMPMTLLALREAHVYAVIEMGANHVGEIEYLTKLARPDVALVNNAGMAHLEGFGSLDNIARAKAEIYDGLVDGGIAVINLDDDYAPLWLEHCAAMNVFTFSMTDSAADVYAEPVADGVYRFSAADESVEVTLPVPGRHNVMNALAATAVTLSVGVPLQSVAASLRGFRNIPGRLALKTAAGGTRVIDDTYNANPRSVAAAIDVLSAMQGDAATTRVLVMGDMAELGEDAEKLHRDIGIRAKASGVDSLYATGDLSRAAVDAFGDSGFYFADKKSLAESLAGQLTGNEIVLVKGSRSAAMEEVVEQILSQHNNKRMN